MNELMVQGLLHLITVDDGATQEQQRLLRTISTHLMGVDAEVLDRATPLMPSNLAAELIQPGERRRFLQLAIRLSLSRHPASENQLRRLEEWSEAMDFHGVELQILQALFHSSAADATSDFIRIYSHYIPELSEQHGGTISANGEMAYDQDFFDAVEALNACPRGSVGWCFVEFYRRNNMILPCRETPNPGYYVCHDMNHVICGYEPTGPGEIALGAFKLALDDSEANWLASLTNFLIHEVGMFMHGTSQQFVPYGGGGEPYHGVNGKRGALDLPGASDLLAEALHRGSLCRVDFSKLDHLAIAETSLVDIRHQFNVLPLQNPMFDDAEFWPS